MNAAPFPSLSDKELSSESAHNAAGIEPLLNSSSINPTPCWRLQGRRDPLCQEGSQRRPRVPLPLGP